MNQQYNNDNRQLIDYQNHLNYTCRADSIYQIDLVEFKSKQGKYSSNSDPLHNYLDFLDGEEKINEEYCAHLEQYINGLLSSNAINQLTFNEYHYKLNFYLVKTRYDAEKISKNPITQFETNNFIKSDDSSSEDMKNSILPFIKKKGIGIYLSSRGKICIRFSLDSDFKEYSLAQANIVFPNATGLNVQFTKEERKDELINDKFYHYICVKNLLLVQEEVLDTTQNKEFYKKDGLWYRNIFKPSKLLKLNKQPRKVPLNIFYLISHLVNNDIGRFFLFLNWLAYFIQTLKKAQVAYLFKGHQGAGKGTLFKLIEKIFNPEYCKQINGDSLKSNYLGAFIENTLFLNFDEISYKTIGKGSFSAFLKAIITNSEVTSEKKGINMVRPTKVSAQVILFSNADNPIEVEATDRRFIVNTTAGNIKDTNFFGLGNFDALEEAMMDEIEDFVMYLKLFKVDTKKANTAYDTPEKSLMVNNTENNLQWLVNALLTNDWQYFQPLQNINVVLYNIFMKQLVKYRVFQKHLILVYTTLYPNDKHIESATTLIKHLEKIAPHIFGDHNLYKTNGDKYYSLILEDIKEPMPKIPNFKH